jgi:hypothetical protein
VAQGVGDRVVHRRRTGRVHKDVCLLGLAQISPGSRAVPRSTARSIAPA